MNSRSKLLFRLGRAARRFNKDAVRLNLPDLAYIFSMAELEIMHALCEESEGETDGRSVVRPVDKHRFH